jgi:hypothetical protein
MEPDKASVDVNGSLISGGEREEHPGKMANEQQPAAVVACRRRACVATDVSVIRLA